MPLKTLTRFQPNNPFRMPPLTRAISCLLLAWAGAEERAWANPDLKFDVATLCCPCTTEKHLCQSQLDHFLPIRLRAKSENLGISPVPTKENTHKIHRKNPILARNRIGRVF